MSSIQKIIAQTKEDIKTLRMAFEFTTDRKFRIDSGDLITRHLGMFTIKYSMWAYHTFNEDQYLDFLKNIHSNLIECGNPFDEFKPMADNINLKSIEVIDRLDFSLKFLGQNLDIPLPRKIMPSLRDQKISITNESYDIKTLIKDLEIFIVRAEMLQKNIESFKENNDSNSIEEYKNSWIEKLTQNHFDELLTELIKYFEVQKNNEQRLLAVQLKQRYNKIKKDEQFGIKNSDVIDIELNKITKSILEIIQ